MNFVINIYENQPAAQCAMRGYSGMKTLLKSLLSSDQFLNNAIIPEVKNKKVCFYPLAVEVMAAAVFSISARAEEAATAAGSENAVTPNHWGFNLSPYMWLPGISGGLSAQQQSSSVNLSFIDIVDKPRRFPLEFIRI